MFTARLADGRTLTWWARGVLRGPAELVARLEEAVAWAELIAGGMVVPLDRMVGPPMRATLDTDAGALAVMLATLGPELELAGEVPRLALHPPAPPGAIR